MSESIVAELGNVIENQGIQTHLEQAIDSQITELKDNLLNGDTPIKARVKKIASTPNPCITGDRIEVIQEMEEDDKSVSCEHDDNDHELRVS